MSTVSGLSTSAGVAYATQLAQTSALNRSLYNLGTAVQNGDLTSAGSILSAIMKANPQFAAVPSGGSSTAQDPINQDFQALSTAITNNQVDAAKGAWQQVKSDLAKDGVPALTNGATATAQLLTQTQTSEDQALLSALFGSTPDASVTTLLGGSSSSSSGPDLNSLVSDWVTYKTDGSTSSPVATPTVGGNVNTTA